MNVVIKDGFYNVLLINQFLKQVVQFSRKEKRLHIRKLAYLIIVHFVGKIKNYC